MVQTTRIGMISKGTAGGRGAPAYLIAFRYFFLGCSALASESIYSCLSGKQ